MGKIGSKSLVFVAAVAILVVVAIVGGCSGKRDVKDGNVAATVNGASIYFDEVNGEHASLSAEQKESISKADTLSFVIEREILYQQAVKEGLKATEEEQQQAYEKLLLESNVTEQELAGQLAAGNSTVERLKATLQKQILINKLLDKVAKKSYIIKKEEVKAYYGASGLSSSGVSFEAAEKGIVDLLTAQRQKAETEAYIQGLKDKAEVVIIAVPG